MTIAHQPAWQAQPDLDKNVVGEVQHSNDWKILIVDSEGEIHCTARLASKNFLFENKGVTFISAYSAQEAQRLIQEHPDTALILLSIILEAEPVGLVVIEYIRTVLKNQLVRIVAYTDHPGLVTEKAVFLDYDINDLKLKSELTEQQLFHTIVAALRSFRDISTLNRIVAATARFVPPEFLSLLHKKSIVEVELGDQIQQEMTIMFSDIRDFTSLSEQMTPKESFQFINAYLGRVGPVIRKHKGFIDKYIGDAIMALFPRQANDAVQAAIAMQREICEYNQERRKKGYQPLQVGVGIHTGNVMLGMVGETRRMECTVISNTVNLASRLEGLTKVYGASIVISEDTLSNIRRLTQYNLRFLDKVKVKGTSDWISVFEIFDGDPPTVITLKQQTRVNFEKGLHLYHNHEFREAIEQFNKVLEANPNDRAVQVYLRHATHCVWVGAESKKPFKEG